jgi:hypothetical protein
MSKILNIKIMDSRRNEDNRPTIDYRQYEDYPDEDYERRFSLHTVGGNPMMGESMDFNYAEQNQEDNGQYFIKHPDFASNKNIQHSNYVQNYQIKEESYNYQMLSNQKPEGKNVQSRHSLNYPSFHFLGF